MFIRSTVRAVLLLTLASQFALSQTAESSTPPDGQAIFLRHCAKCHGEHGEGISARVTIAGPNLQAEHDHGDVMTAMEVGPSHMPSFAYVLSVPEMRAVADYVTQKIAVIPLTGGDLSQGGKLFREECAPCHRTAVRGGALAFVGTNAPDLAHTSAAIVAGTIRWGPGPMPEFPASVLTDEQVASIVDYVKLIQHPPSPGGSPLHWYGPVAEGFVAWVVVFGLMFIAGWIERGGKG
jgi:ubiquinol-cytochrome c reductase cytochrome c subunit